MLRWSPLQEGIQALDVAHKLAYYAVTIGQNKLWVEKRTTQPSMP